MSGSIAHLILTLDCQSDPYLLKVNIYKSNIFKYTIDIVL